MKRPVSWREAALRLRALVKALRKEAALREEELREARPLLFEHRRRAASCQGKPNCGGTPMVREKNKWLCHWCVTAPKKRLKKSKEKTT